MNKPPQTPFQRACSIVGGQSTLARLIGLPPAFVNQIARGKRPIPDKHGAAIETATGGQVTRQELFPDSWQRIWPELTKPTTQQRRRTA